MKRTKTTEITIEMDEILFLRGDVGIVATAPFAGWCIRCDEQAEMLSPEMAARAFGIGVRHIYRLIEAGHVHFAETPDGLLLVCLASLSYEAGVAGGDTLLLNPTQSET